MLEPMRDNDDTLLHFEIDSQAIAKSVWGNFITSLSASEAQHLRDWPSIESALSDLVQQALNGHSSSPATADNTGETQLSTIDKNTSSPALWLERLISMMRAINYRTLEILALRIEGFDDRDIAEQLETGLRCIKRITKEMQLAWNEGSITAD